MEGSSRRYCKSKLNAGRTRGTGIMTDILSCEPYNNIRKTGCGDISSSHLSATLVDIPKTCLVTRFDEIPRSNALRAIQVSYANDIQCITITPAIVLRRHLDT